MQDGDLVDLVELVHVVLVVVGRRVRRRRFDLVEDVLVGVADLVDDVLVGVPAAVPKLLGAQWGHAEWPADWLMSRFLCRKGHCATAILSQTVRIALQQRPIVAGAAALPPPSSIS